MTTNPQQAAWPLAALLLCIPAASAPQLHTLQDVRHWSLAGVTRVAIQISAPVEVRRDRLHSPERYFFDFVDTVSGRRGIRTIETGDSLVKRIRVAEAKPGVTRVVLDLSGDYEVTTSELSNPYRLMVEVKTPGYQAPPGGTERLISAAPLDTSVPFAGPRPKSFTPPPVREALRNEELGTPPALAPWTKPEPMPLRPLFAFLAIRYPAYRPPARVETVAASLATKPLSATSSPLARATSAPEKPSLKPAGPAPVAVAATPARRGMDNGTSMTRALGLKIRRVVLDAGHGGHDQGSSGPSGLLEKELVLDVTLRLGQLIEKNLGSEIVYTRSDDRYIPLEERTRIANSSKADLFLSIHANSSTIRSVSGVETYFLSFTTSKEALEVAGRENATSERSVFELQDLLQKIAMQDKIEESRDFATKINSALYRVWGQAGAARNRGVKKAPFVVLIGASMPSVLAEIGFLSNPRDEREMKKGEVRQRIAEALYKGIAQYADSLSHFAVASRGATNNE